VLDTVLVETRCREMGNSIIYYCECGEDNTVIDVLELHVKTIVYIEKG
jgi:hypothetical protein